MKYSIHFVMAFLFLNLFKINGQNLPEGYPETNRSKTLINAGWKFHQGEADADYFKKDYNDTAWENVNVPHGMQLSSITLDGNPDDKYQKTYLRDVAWYRKNIRIPQSTGNKIVLEFEGAHQITDLWVNGQHVGQFAVSGYTPFHFDITDFVKKGEENQITLLLDNRQYDYIPPDPGPFDYIKFAGLYRDVYLVEYDPLHITYNWEDFYAGIHITTPTVDPLNMNATLNVRTTVSNEYYTPRETTIVTRLIDADGIVVLKKKITKTISPGTEHTFVQTGSIEDNLHLWDIDNPYLYRVNSMVLDGNNPVDVLENKVGFRKIEMHNDKGLFLNGKPIKLIGMNRHQHYGFIGDALPNSLHYKDIYQLKQYGMNVVRTAHYPQDNAIIEACDELGMLVYEEAPTWMSIGSKKWFDNYEIAARRMVRNHRNHPSIIIWGAGINHRGYVPRAHNIIKEEDPVRLTASQNSEWTGFQTSGLTDIYAQMAYSDFYWSGKEPLLAMEGRRGPKAVNEYKSHPMRLGLITWTAHAYYTFHKNTKVPSLRTRSGSTNIFRWPSKELNWYSTELLEKPSTFINGQWTKDIKELEIYSNAEKVELLLNGKPYKKAQLPDKDTFPYLDHPPFYIKIDDYKAGKLTANGIVNGKVVSSQTVHTPEKAVEVKLMLDTEGRQVTADGSDILVGYAYAVDKNGTAVDVDTKVSFSVEGSASIVGDKENIGSNPMEFLRGVAPVLIKAGNTPGEVMVTARIKGLKSAKASFKTVKAGTNVIAANVKPIYDFEKVRVDIGEKKQLVQFEWTPWFGTDMQSGILDFKECGGFTAELKSAKDNSQLRWLGEVNIIGKYNFAHGDGVLGADTEGLVLEFKGLKKGTYKVITSHHSPKANTNNMDPNRKRQANDGIYTLPFANKIDIIITDAKSKSARYKSNVTAGKIMMEEPFAINTFSIESDGISPIKLLFKDAEGDKGVWLNTFEISQWK